MSKKPFFTGPFAPICESYVAQKRASGLDYNQQAKPLRLFDNFCKDSRFDAGVDCRSRSRHPADVRAELVSRPIQLRTKKGAPLWGAPFLVRVVGLEPTRKAREPKGYVTLVKDFQSPPYHEGRTSFQRFKRYSVMTGRIPAKS